MPTRTRAVVMMLVAFCLAAAVSAPLTFAQSAGDDQYADPFEKSGGGKTSTTSGSSTPSAPAVKPAAPSAAPDASTAPLSPNVAELPRTGLDLRPLAGAGFVLLAAGLLLVRWSRPARR